MKKLTPILTLCLAAIFVFSFITLLRAFDSYNQEITRLSTHLFGFDPGNESKPAFVAFEKEISEKLYECKTSIKTIGFWSVMINFLITVISGLSTLFTTISTIKNKQATQQVSIAVAILAFVSTMLSFALSQINSHKEGVENRQKQIVSIKNELESYKSEEVEAQIPGLKRRLDEI